MRGCFSFCWFLGITFQVPGCFYCGWGRVELRGCWAAWGSGKERSGNGFPLKRGAGMRKSFGKGRFARGGRKIGQAAHGLGQSLRRRRHAEAAEARPGRSGGGDSGRAAPKRFCHGNAEVFTVRGEHQAGGGAESLGFGFAEEGRFIGEAGACGHAGAVFRAN